MQNGLVALLAIALTTLISTNCRAFKQLNETPIEQPFVSKEGNVAVLNIFGVSLRFAPGDLKGIVTDLDNCVPPLADLSSLLHSDTEVACFQRELVEVKTHHRKAGVLLDIDPARSVTPEVGNGTQAAFLGTFRRSEFPVKGGAHISIDVTLPGVVRWKPGCDNPPTSGQLRRTPEGLDEYYYSPDYSSFMMPSKMRHGNTHTAKDVRCQPGRLPGRSCDLCIVSDDGRIEASVYWPEPAFSVSDWPKLDGFLRQALKQILPATYQDHLD